MSLAGFIDRLANVRAPNAFNPWGEQCLAHDVPDAPAVRRRNLAAAAEWFATQPSGSLWLARDLGYRGGRRTGLAMTDDMRLGAAAELFGCRLERATLGPPVAERTSSIVWSAIAEIGEPVFLWNVFPFHPHLDGHPQTNRPHTLAEARRFAPLLTELIGLLAPRRIVAIGRDAALALSAMNIEASAVRHPSYGGHVEFRAGLLSLYKQYTAL